MQRGLLFVSVFEAARSGRRHEKSPAFLARHHWKLHNTQEHTMRAYLLASAFTFAFFASPMFLMGQVNEVEFKITKITQGDYELEVIDNSKTFSHGLAINSSGAIIGQREYANADQTMLGSKYFFCDDKRILDVPTVEQYTNVEVQALSDSNIAVGLATRPLGNPDGGVIAIVWDTATGKVTKLPRPPTTLATHAQDISADGRRISGYATGEGLLRPCVWTWNEGSSSWDVEILPTLLDHNPYVMSSRAIISPNGKLIAACCTFDLSAGVIDSSLFVWREVEGKWERELLNDEQLHLRDMNDSGVIIGSISTDRGLRMPRVIDAKGKMLPVLLLAGDHSGEVWGINSAGVVVGFSDDPPGPDGGPQAIMWVDGKTTAINLGEAVFSVASGINDDGLITGYVEVVPTESDPDVEPKILAFRTLTKLPSSSVESSPNGNGSDQ